MSQTYTIQQGGKGHMPFIALEPATLRRLTTGGNKRVICTLNGSYTLHAAIMNRKDGPSYIMIGNKHLKALKLRPGSSVKVQLRKDDTEWQFPMPEELAEVLATDPAAEKIFQSLTPGNKRGILALVTMVKSTDKKIERALLIAEKMKKGITRPALLLKK